MESILVSFAHASVAVGTITTGRAQALVGLAVGLIGVIIGGRALARSAGGKRRSRGIVAAIVGLIGMALGGLHLATATGAIGTGSGKLGAIVAVVVGLIGMALGLLAIARVRRIQGGP
jgi:hypothetical protein